MSEEEWRPVEDFEGWYEVSNLGRVRSLDRVITRSDGMQLRCRGVTLRPGINGNGYPSVVLHRNGAYKPLCVHQLVARAFVAGYEPGLIVLHWDDDKNNNVPANLRWGTLSDNAYDRVRNGRNNHANKTHCSEGHPFDAGNTYPRPGGGRGCRVCRNQRMVEHRLRRKIEGKVAA